MQPNSDCCAKLKKLIALDDKAKSPLDILYSSEYHALSFEDDMLGLNCNFESLGGMVDIDWMLRCSMYGVGIVPGASHGVYYVAKMLWNGMQFRSPLANIHEEGNLNAPNAARMWLNSGMQLREIFAPALRDCKCE